MNKPTFKDKIMEVIDDIEFGILIAASKQNDKEGPQQTIIKVHTNGVCERLGFANYLKIMCEEDAKNYIGLNSSAYDRSAELVKKYHDERGTIASMPNVGGATIDENGKEKFVFFKNKRKVKK